MVDFEHFFVFYLLLILGPVIGLWIISAWRDRKLRSLFPIQGLYRCPECLRFYESDEQIEKLRCPICGRQNERLKI